MPDYVATAYAAAVAAGKTSAEIAAATYPQVATHSGVTIAGDGSSPSDFHYRNVKLRVSQRLAREEFEATGEQRRLGILAKVTELPEFSGAWVEFVGKGKQITGPAFVVRRT